MRPIHLSVAGLHSFREQQEVDFLSLCEGGVFGIFGPTGSGKSSLLDAITLALYGTVERANNNTQGIMNHAEDQIQVSFTFELRNAEGSIRYKVERSFKRTGDFTLRTATCRLLQISEETIVLADKSQEVHQKVQELLGLTVDDFTRAVVLPQGKFAEFLSLKGIDRRQMLQRLFHLEQYGDRLNEKLRQRVASSKAASNEAFAEQQGLGDASKEALQQAEQRVKESENFLREVELRRKQMDRTYEKQQRIWLSQTELNKVEVELQALDQQKEDFVQLEKDLQRAQEAHQLKPYLEELEQANSDVHVWSRQREKVSKELMTAKATEEKQTQVYQRTVKEREEQLPIWIERQAQLKHVQELQKELIQLQQEEESLAKSINDEQKKEEVQCKHLEHSKALHSKAMTKQKELIKEVEALSITVEEREKVRLANSEQTAIQSQELQLHEIQTEYSIRNKEQNKTELELSQVMDKSEKNQQSVDDLLEKTVNTYREGLQLQHSLNNQLSLAQKLLDNETKHIELQKGKDLAIELAHQLRDGESCPVCGSTEHPHPTLAIGDDLQQRIKWIDDYKEWMVKGKEQGHHLQTGKHALEQIYENIVESFSDNKNLNVASLQELASNDVAVALEEDEIHSEVNECPIVLELISQLQDKSRVVLKEHREINRHLTELKTTMKSLQKDLQERYLKMEELQREVSTRKKEWTNSYPTYSFEKIKEEQIKVDQNDRKSASLKQRIDQSVDFIEEKERKIEKANESLRLVQLQQAENRSTYKQMKMVMERKQEQLTKQVGTEDVFCLIQEAVNKVTELKKQEQEATQQWQLIREELQQKEKEMSVATESLKQAEQRQQKVSEQWHKVLVETIFTAMEEVKEALISKEKQEGWMKEIQEYRDQEKKWNQEKTRLHGLLGNQRIMEEEWLATLKLREQIGQEWDHALKEQGATTKDLEQLKAKHHRFLSLEEKRLEAEQALEKLGKLQSVFRGNSFVEFIAEEQLMQVCRDASQRLGTLTRQRYALEVDSGGGFLIRDDANGGVKRPVSTLSGGETFLTSLALALSLSAQIQLSGQYPLEFFFLDEGFGTLDADLLDAVVTALENLHTDHLSVGVISHVPELRARLARRLVVEPAEASGRGSRLYLETL